MSDKMMLTLEDLRVLANTAERNGTQRNFPDVMFQWAEAAEAEIRTLRNVGVAQAEQVERLTAECDALATQLQHANDVIQLRDAVRAERDALRAKLDLIKAHVVGDRFPNWDTPGAVYASRGYISDLCDDTARKDAKP